MKTEQPSPLQKAHPDLYEAIMAAHKSADDANAAEKEYYEKMRVALKMLRERLGATAKMFGGLAGIKEAQVYAFESGRRRWSKRALTRLNENFAMF